MVPPEIAADHGPLHLRMADSSTQICITGRAPTSTSCKGGIPGRGHRRLAKPRHQWAVQVKEPGQLVWTFRKAFRIAQEGRRGPVLIDLPLDVQKSGLRWTSTRSAEVRCGTRQSGRGRGHPAGYGDDTGGRAPDPDARSWVIIADGAEELVELAEYLLQVPVSPTYMGKGVDPRGPPVVHGHRGPGNPERYANALFLESDLVVGIGNRWADPAHRRPGDLSRRQEVRPRVDIDPRQERDASPRTPDLARHLRREAGVEALLQTARDTTGECEPDEWVERVDELRSTLLRKMDFDDRR